MTTEIIGKISKSVREVGGPVYFLLIISMLFVMGISYTHLKDIANALTSVSFGLENLNKEMVAIKETVEDERVTREKEVWFSYMNCLRNADNAKQTNNCELVKNGRLPNR